MERKKLIELHDEWLKSKNLPSLGLCNSVITGNGNQLLLNRFIPNDKEFTKLATKGYCTTYWGSGLKLGDDRKYTRYTPLRQTIVLLICAMKGEI